MIKKIKNCFKIFLISFIYVVPANAACDFIINIGDKGAKLFEKFATPMPMFNGQFMLPVQSPEICPNDNLNEMIAVDITKEMNSAEEITLCVRFSIKIILKGSSIIPYS